MRRGMKTRHLLELFFVGGLELAGRQHKPAAAELFPGAGAGDLLVALELSLEPPARDVLDRALRRKLLDKLKRQAVGFVEQERLLGPDPRVLLKFSQAPG